MLQLIRQWFTIVGIHLIRKTVFFLVARQLRSYTPRPPNLVATFFGEFFKSFKKWFFSGQPVASPLPPPPLS